LASLKQSIDSLQRSFDKLASNYDLVNSTLADRVHEFVSMHHIKEHLLTAKVTSVLDAGGGTGRWSVALAQMGYQVTLVDVSPRSAAIAEQKASQSGYSIEVLVGNVEQLELEEASFDFVLCQGPLSYTPQPEQMLSEVSRVLKPGGTLWLDFYNGLGWAIENADLSFKIEAAVATDKLIQMSDWDYPARIFSTERVVELCRKCGLKMLRIFGNHVLMGSLPMDRVYSHRFASAEFESLKAAELALSDNQGCVGASKICQLLAVKE
jgi:ubiquinone/menaquinone biosynthesis C-methylase UbiE